MQTIKVNKANIPLWSGANGDAALTVTVDDLNQALTPGDSPIVNASFEVDGNNDFQLGSTASVSLGVKAGATFKFAPLWKDHTKAAPELVANYGLGPALAGGNMLLGLELGAGADVSAAASFHYNLLSAGATLAAGADASFVQVRSLPANTPFGEAVAGFFEKLSLPGGVTAPPEPGEVIALEYGGYLNLGVNATAGYQLKGTKSFDVAGLKLSEIYQFSAAGKLTLAANLAGRFSVEVRAGSSPGWAAVTVKRSRANDLQLLADLNIGGEIDTKNLPPTGKEFLGALLGVRAGNWINLIDSAASEAGKIQTIDELKAKLDDLAGDFFARYAGKALDQLLPPEADALLGRLQKVVDSYRNLDRSAIALFDRYFDPAASQIQQLETHLSELAKLTAWDQLKGEVDPLLWNVVQQITNGDPLGWILGRIPGTELPSLPEFLKRINDTLALIRSDAHGEIRSVIQLAKTEFGLDHFFAELDKVDSKDKLKTAVSAEAKHFVGRLINQAIDSLNPKDLDTAFGIVRKVVEAKDAFWKHFDDALQQAAQQTFALGIEAAYARAGETSALIDLEIRLADDAGNPVPAGRELMHLAGRGDFQKILATYQPDIVKLKSGLLTHNLSTSTGVTINIAGWHENFQYEEMYKVIVHAGQQIVPAANGLLNVFTNIDLTNEKQKRGRTTRAAEEMHTNFLLRFFGETRGVLNDSKFDERDQSYLVDVITGQVAAYEADFTDSDTTAVKLAHMLAFAKQLGLDAAGATQNALDPVLELKNGSYGPVTAEYAVQFAPRALQRLFDTPVSAGDIRGALKTLIVANYFNKGAIANVAWLYASDDVKKLRDDNGPNFVNAGSILEDAIAAGEVRLESPIPGVEPRLDSTGFEIRLLADSLFRIELGLVKAFDGLQKVLHTPGGIPLKDFRNRLSAFGDVLKEFDNRTLGDNTTFAVFDALVRLSSPAAEARSSSLAMTATKARQEHKLVFLLGAQAAAAAA